MLARSSASIRKGSFTMRRASAGWADKERSMRRRRLKKLLARRHELPQQGLPTAYCLVVRLKSHNLSVAPSLAPRTVLEKFAAIEMIHVNPLTADGGDLILPRYTQLDADRQLLSNRLKLTLLQQPPPAYSWFELIPTAHFASLVVVSTFFVHFSKNQ